MKNKTITIRIFYWTRHGEDKSYDNKCVVTDEIESSMAEFNLSKIRDTAIERGTEIARALRVNIEANIDIRIVQPCYS